LYDVAVNVYPTQYQLHEVMAHVVALLERRRTAAEQWSDELERSLHDEAVRALTEAGSQFREMADDGPYWQRLTEQVLGVGLPRYFRLAKAQQALEHRRYDVWRGGDFISRAAFAVTGLVLGVVILRTAIPDWLEPLPLALFIGGPLLPDAQVWFSKRKYRLQLSALVEDMRLEAADAQTYQPLGVVDSSSGDSQAAQRPEEHEKTRLL
jgi:hypothetical protein